LRIDRHVARGRRVIEPARRRGAAEAAIEDAHDGSRRRRTKQFREFSHRDGCLGIAVRRRVVRDDAVVVRSVTCEHDDYIIVSARSRIFGDENGIVTVRFPIAFRKKESQLSR
jgi:hypothetical protein